MMSNYHTAETKKINNIWQSNNYDGSDGNLKRSIFEIIPADDAVKRFKKTTTIHKKWWHHSSDEENLNYDDDDDEDESDSDNEGFYKKYFNKSDKESCMTLSRLKMYKQLAPTQTFFFTNQVTTINPFQFQVASYNVWSGLSHLKIVSSSNHHQNDNNNNIENNNETLYPERRMIAIVRALKQCHSKYANPLCFIAFQDVSSQCKSILTHQLQNFGYQMFHQSIQSTSTITQNNTMNDNVGDVVVDDDSDKSGMLLGVMKPLKVLESSFIEFNCTNQHRGILYARTQSLLFCSVHLESSNNYSKTKYGMERETQVKQIKRFCKNQLNQYKELKTVILVGDFGWSENVRHFKGRNEAVPLLSLLNENNGNIDDVLDEEPLLWKDAWMGNDEEDGYTVDSFRNVMLQNHSRIRQRIDRCLYLNRRCEDEMDVYKFQKIGMHILSDVVWHRRSKKNKDDDDNNNNKKNVKRLPIKRSSKSDDGTKSLNDNEIMAVCPSTHWGIVVTFSPVENVCGTTT